MNDRYAKHLSDMKARHAEDLDLLRRALAARAIRPRVLRSLEKRYAALERETEKILVTADRAGRGQAHERSEERA